MTSNSFKTNTVSVGINNFLLILIGLVSSIAIARALGPANQGLLALILLVPALLSKFIGLGTQAAATYFVNSKKEPSERVASTVITWSWLASSILGLGVILFYRPLYDAPSIFGYNPSLVISLFIGVFLVSNFVRVNVIGLFYSHEKYKEANKFNLLNDLLPTAVSLLLWGAGVLSLENILVLYLANSLFGLTYSLITLRRHINYRVKIDPPLLKAFIGYGMPVYYNGLTNTLQQRIGYFFVASYLSIEHVGYYAIAYSVAEKLGELAKPLVVTHLPKTIQLHQSSENEAWQFTSGILSRLGAAYLIALLPYALATYFLLPVFYSDAYRPSIEPAMILSVGIAVWGMIRIVNNYLASTGRQLVNSLMLTAGLVINVTLLLIGRVSPSLTSFSYAMTIALIGTLTIQFIYLRSQGLSLNKALPNFSSLFTSLKEIRSR
jgi:O-antigen/teichoic acid export membrane protein